MVAADPQHALQQALAFNTSPSGTPRVSSKGLSREDPPQFDHMAGATVKSRAGTHAVQHALRYFDEHRSSLVEPGAHE